MRCTCECPDCKERQRRKDIEERNKRLSRTVVTVERWSADGKEKEVCYQFESIDSFVIKETYDPPTSRPDYRTLTLKGRFGVEFTAASIVVLKENTL